MIADRIDARPRKTFFRWSFVTAAWLVVGLVAAHAAAAPTEPPIPAIGARPRVGEAPPELSAERIVGTEPVSIPGLAGRVVILDFWATWCAPCRELMPALDAMYRAHRARGLSIIGLSPEPEDRIREYLRVRPVDYTVARDVGGTIRAYGVRSIPALILIDRRGRVREVINGVDATTIGYLDYAIQHLLDEP